MPVGGAWGEEGTGKDGWERKGRIRLEVNHPAWGPNIMIARDMGSQWAGGTGLSTLHRDRCAVKQLHHESNSSAFPRAGLAEPCKTASLLVRSAHLCDWHGSRRNKLVLLANGQVDHSNEPQHPSPQASDHR